MRYNKKTSLMIRNYFTIAWRSLSRNKRTSAINIFGLGLGVTCSLLIFLWVRDERKIDAFHVNGSRLFQVYERSSFDGKIQASYSTQGLLAGELKRVIPEVQYASGMEYVTVPGTKATVEAGNKVTKMLGFFAGEDFFNMFTYPLLKGSKGTALAAPNTIAISRDMALFFFGSPEEAVGKTIRFEDRQSLLVTAVFENVPLHSSQQFDFLRSWVDFKKENDWINNWGNQSPSSFVQLRPGANKDQVEAKIKDFVYRYMAKSPNFKQELALQSYPERYLYSSFKGGTIDGGRIEYVRLFTSVAIFILLIACINFMNLATAQSARRAKEVGLRKVIGAARWSLLVQFIGEALLLTAFSIVAALVLTALILPAFNQLTEKQLALPVAQPAFWLTTLGLLLITGLVAGSYPAVFLSALKPVRVLKGSLKFGWGAAFFRKGLVVFQFTLSLLLIIGMMIVNRQVQYIRTKNLGYDRDNLVYIPIEGELAKKYSLFKEEAGKLMGVVDVSKMRNSPTVIEHHTGSISWPGKDPNLTLSFADGVVGYDFVKTIKLQLKEGRDFSRDYPSDSLGFIVNETAAGRIGWKEPIGQTLDWGGHKGRVIGVLKDFHFNSLHEAIEPLVVRLDENWSWGTILIRIRAGQTQEAIAGLEKLSKEINPKFPFTWQFSDWEFSRLYKSETVVNQLSAGFAVLAVLISCLGLFGLATFTAAQRTKEIGVRKVLGATTSGIAALLSGEFLRLIVLAIVVAFPVAWYMMHRWLQQFAYKIEIDMWVFLLAGGIMIGIALLTVSYQSIKAALANPVKALRSE
jgi:putative ABC transport system permease protein